MAVRGQKVGTFKGKAFYILPGNKCRWGSDGRTQNLGDFAKNLTQAEVAELYTLTKEEILAAVGVVEESRVLNPAQAAMAAKLEAESPNSVNDFNVFPAEGKISIKGIVMPVGEHLGRMPKGEARQMRRTLRALGFRGMAAAERIPV